MTTLHGRAKMADGETGRGGTEGNGVKQVKGYLSVAEAAKRIGVDRSRVYRIIKAGRLKAVEVAGRIVLRESDVAKYKPLPIGRPRKKKARRKASKKGGRR